MKVAIDVFYKEETAKIVTAIFDNWFDELPQKIIVKNKTPVSAYIPGEFYKRELPCLVDAISDLNIEEIEVIIIDGYVYLDNMEKPGLGFYLYEYLGGKLPVIGVAKNPFHLNTKYVKNVYRGKSSQPLYVTSVGTDLNKAAEDITSMWGQYRMPNILKLIDTETKK
jgi:deoxyribonuclease V